jgi:hypothetical protein
VTQTTIAPKDLGTTSLIQWIWEATPLQQRGSHKRRTLAIMHARHGGEVLSRCKVALAASTGNSACKRWARRQALRRTPALQGEKVMPHQRTAIRVGQRLIKWDGSKGYVALNSRGKRVFGRGERFLVEWVDEAGDVEDAVYLTLEQFDTEGIRVGRGLMPWAK